MLYEFTDSQIWTNNLCCCLYINEQWNSTSLTAINCFLLIWSHGLQRPPPSQNATEGLQRVECSQPIRAQMSGLARYGNSIKTPKRPHQCFL